jgi:hypothetical protein
MASIDERFDALEHSINALLAASVQLLIIAKEGTTRKEDSDIGFLRECQMLVEGCGMPSSMHLEIWDDGTFNMMQEAFSDGNEMQRGNTKKSWAFHKTADAIAAMRQADWVEVES